MKIQNLALASVLSLAGCAAPTPQDGATPVPAPMEDMSSPQYSDTKPGALEVTYTKPAVKQSAVGFRTTGISVVQTGGNDSGRSEAVRVVKAKCALRGDGYQTTFTTPAEVNLPSHGPTTKPVTMTCEYNGQSYTERFNPINLSANARAASAVAGAVFCIPCAVTSGAMGSIAQPGDKYGFASIQLKI